MPKRVYMENRIAYVHDLGMIDYEKAYAYQLNLFQENVQKKLLNKQAPEKSIQTQNHLIVCQHPHTYTLGRNGNKTNLLIKDTFLKSIGASFHQINRGGDITYHGPGQIVIYPIFDLDFFGTDIHIFMRNLEEAVIRYLKIHDIVGERWPGNTGVWLDVSDHAKRRKICAMGVHTSRWVTMHGLAFNVSTDLNYFGYIVPCGIQDGGVASLTKEKNATFYIEHEKTCLLKSLASVFELSYNYTEVS